MIVEFYVEVNPDGCMAWQSVDSPQEEVGMGKTPQEAISDLCNLLAAQLASERNGPPSPVGRNDDDGICADCLEKGGRYTTCSNVRECYPENYDSEDEDY